ncbi:hypothetical protein QA648_21200 (plasmid) [Rhizobium sp. CB3171]|uniref:hypothetical protein n=1 Tax=Rhizobium sp. CB3171 TaxID=3039157 RepID=UPI0024B098E8|nr:hypothetical protein [Rhizobium sp. CB3171]WFU05696.1 hypothetical protein QA648_21200 [Rhizobium sp. CB3171]
MRTFEPQRFCNEVPFLEHLASKGVEIFDRQGVGLLTEAGLWGCIRYHGLVGDMVIVSDVPIPMKPPLCSEMIAPLDSGMISPLFSGVCRR